MFSAVKKLFALPSFDTPQQDRQAAILNSILWLALTAASSRLFIIAIDPDEVLFDALGERFGGVALLGACVILLKYGYLRFTTALLLVGTLLSTALVAANLGNLAGDPNAIIISLIVVSGLIAGPRGVLWTGTSAIGMTLVITFLYESDIIPSVELVTEPSLGTGISLSILFATLTYLLYLASRTLDRLLDRFALVNKTLNIEMEERSRASEALRQSQAELQLTLDNAPLGILTLDLNGEILRVNRALCDLLEYSAETLTHQRIQDALFAEGLATFDARLKQIQYGATFTQPLEQQFQTQSGRLVQTNLQMGLIRDSKNYPLHIVATVEDVTERKRIHQQLQIAQKQESIGILAGGIAHDFNNLLVAMLGQSSLALQRIEMGQPVEPNINKIVSAANKAATLTRQLLAYAGKGQIEKRPIALNDLLRENEALLAVALPKNVHIATQLADHLPSITGDPGQLQQVVMNLLINAGEAMPAKGGAIRIKTDLVHLNDTAAELWRMGESSLSSGDYALLEIADSGSGMPQETIDHIFDPFFTTKATGHGLGLAAVLGIVRSHGGSLRVQSVVGKGTVFRIIFPTNSEPLEARPPVEDVEGEVASDSNSGLILIIDDEDSVRETASDMLEMSGYNVITADGGRSGISSFKQRHREIDVIILDMTMPEMSGAEVFKRLRAIDPNIPVVISSGHSRAQLGDTFAGADLVEFLPKPYNFTNLEKTVRRNIAARHVKA